MPDSPSPPRSLALAAVSGLLACHAGPAGPATPPATTTSALVEVARGHARLSIPLGRPATGPWRWYEPDTKDNYLEFEWAIQIAADTGAYHVGFKIFKLPGSRPRTGTLAQLIEDGQIDIALEAVRQGRRTVEVTRYPLTGHIEGNVFVFEISDSAATQAVFGGRPRTGVVWRYLNGKRTPPLEAWITYPL
jgi:hypothetical protein